MITEKELLEAITECESEPITAAKISKLANFYIIYDHLFGEPLATEHNNGLKKIDTLSVSGESEFLQQIDGMKVDKVLKVIDELLEVIKVTNPRLYDGVLRKLND
ncbi:MAG: hypothetical protein J6S71_02990 [Clostridia bacterium]|nr:hypothetical protein [Clostridia bacterium]